MTLERLTAFTIHWVESPPVHTAFSAALRGLSGGKGKRSVPRGMDDAPGAENMPPRPGEKRQGTRRESVPDLPEKNGNMYDAPDVHSPALQSFMKGVGGDIHVYRHKSLPRG